MRAIGRGLFLPAVAALCMALPGCAKPSSAPKLMIFCGAGLRPAAAELLATFASKNGIEVSADYAGSGALLSKLKLARQGDLFMPGDKRWVDLAAQQGLILEQKFVCYFVPTILVQKGNPKKIRGLRDLLKPGVRLGVGNAKYCAIGRVTKEIFEKNSIPWQDVERTLAFASATVNELALHIQARSLDAVIIWDALAKQWARYGDELPVPAKHNVISTVNIGVLKFTKNRKLAEAFVKFAASDRGRSIFKKHGYRVDPPE